MGVKLLIAGDLCAAGKPAGALAAPHETSLWNELSTVIDGADFAIVNVECPLTDHPRPILKSGPSLWAPTSCAAGIRAAGFGAACLANNHIMDAGRAGLFETLEACRRVGLTPVGAGKDYMSASAPLREKVRGLDLAVLAFAENEFSTTDGDQPGASPLDPFKNAAQIVGAQRQDDFVLVLLHGGVEHYPLPSPRLQATCRFFVESGADAVICHHSHVIGGSEIYQGKPIVYGLGNLLFDSFGGAADDWFVGCLAILEVERHEVHNLELLAYRQDPGRPSIALLAGSERDSTLARIARLSSTLIDPELLAVSWKAHCSERRADVLESALGLTKPASWLLHKGLLPSARFGLKRKKLAKLYNILTCESHHETASQVLRELLEEIAPENRADGDESAYS